MKLWGKVALMILVSSAAWVTLWVSNMITKPIEEVYCIPCWDKPVNLERENITVVADSDFVRFYGSPEGSAETDLQQVLGLIDAAFMVVKNFDEIPLADNSAFTGFLQGENPHQVAWIPPGHPAVSNEGELLDRWASPLFFHRESSRRTSLRSAGPDRKMWTDDDILWPME